MSTEEPMEVGQDRRTVLVKMFSMFKKAYRRYNDQANQDVDGDALSKLFSRFQTVDVQHERGRKMEEVEEYLKELQTTAKSYEFIILVFLLHGNKDCGLQLDFFDEPMPLYTVFDLVKDIETPKVFLIQADDPKFMPKDDSVKANKDSWELDKSKLPKESLVLMSTIPQLIAQFDSARQFVEWLEKPDRFLENVRCSVLVRAIRDELQDPEALSGDFKVLTEKIETKIMETQIAFGCHEKLEWQEAPKTYRECNLSKPLLLDKLC